MKKIKNNIALLIIGILCVPCFNLFAQDSDIQIGINRAPVVKKSMEEDIQYLHKQLPELIKKLQLENKNEIIIDMGGKVTPGSRARFVYMEKVIVKLSGDNVSEITFIYDQANDTGSFHESRKFINKNPSDQSANDLQVMYSNTKGDNEEFFLKTIENEVQKGRVLRIYRDHLNSFVRWLNFYAKKGINNQKKMIHKVLSVGPA